MNPKKIKVGWRARSDLGAVKKIEESITAVGQLQPALVKDLGDGEFEIIAGVRRREACINLGIDMLCVVADEMDEETELRAQLDENTARKDFDLLEVGEGLLRLKQLQEARGAKTKAEVEEFGGDDEAFSSIAAKKMGVSISKARELMALASLPEEVKDEARSAPTTVQRNVKIRGELAKVRKNRKLEKIRKRVRMVDADERGNVKIFNQDNKAFMGSARLKFDAIITDPPYGQRRSLISHVARGAIDSNFGAWDELDVGWLLAASKLLKEGGQILAFSPLEAIGEYKMVAESIGLTWRGAIVWHKTNPGTAHRPVYLSSVEAIVWVTRGAEYTFTPWDNAGAREVHNMIEGPICMGTERLGHPTQKPEWLMRRLIDRHTLRGSMVFDPFAGVGSTLAACAELGRDAIGVERDESFYDVARKRLLVTN